MDKYNLPDIGFGEADVLPDWRDLPDDDTPDDDEELAETPEDVVELLGFDPLGEVEDEVEDEGEAEDGDGPSLRKEDVHYTRRAEDPEEQCVRCEHYNINHSCDLVIGFIAAEGWCEEWEPDDPSIIACDAFVVGDDVEWKEEQHPRDEGGKFTEGGGTAVKTKVKNKVKAALKKHGYTPQGKTESGHFQFSHPTKPHIYVGPASAHAEKVFAGWRTSGHGAEGKGEIALEKYLSGLTGNEVPSGEVEQLYKDINSNLAGLVDKSDKMTEIDAKLTAAENKLGVTKPAAEPPPKGATFTPKIGSLASQALNDAGLNFEWSTAKWSKYSNPDVGDVWITNATKYGKYGFKYVTPSGEIHTGMGLPKLKSHLIKPPQKAATVTPDNEQYLKGIGFTKNTVTTFGNNTGGTYYKNPNGNQLWVSDTSENWTLAGPGVTGVKDGFGFSNLNDAVNDAISNSPPAGKVSMPPGAQVKDGPISSAYTFNNGVNEKGEQYELTDGSILNVSSESGKWALFNFEKSPAYAQYGDGQESLNAAFEALHPRGPGGQFMAKFKPLEDKGFQVKQDEPGGNIAFYYNKASVGGDIEPGAAFVAGFINPNTGKGFLSWKYPGNSSQALDNLSENDLLDLIAQHGPKGNNVKEAKAPHGGLSLPMYQTVESSEGGNFYYDPNSEDPVSPGMSYTLENGDQIIFSDEGDKWIMYPASGDYGEVFGVGQQSFISTYAKHHPEATFAAPSAPAAKPKPSYVPQAVHDKLVAAGYEPKGAAPWKTGAQVQVYGKPDGSIYLANESNEFAPSATLFDPSSPSYKHLDELKKMAGPNVHIGTLEGAVPSLEKSAASSMSLSPTSGPVKKSDVTNSNPEMQSILQKLPGLEETGDGQYKMYDKQGNYKGAIIANADGSWELSGIFCNNFDIPPKEKTGKSPSELATTLQVYTDLLEPPMPGAEELFGPKKEEVKFGGLSITQAAELSGLTPKEESPGVYHFDDPTLNTLYIGSEGDWMIDDKDSHLIKEGTGQKELNAAFEALHPRGEGGKFVAKPGGPEPGVQEGFTKSNAVTSFGHTGTLPDPLNGIAFTEWKPPANWNDVEGQMIGLKEPPLTPTPGHHMSSGLLIEEPDGRIWLVKPKGAYGGYNATFAKGQIETGLSAQANAIKEAWEESGIKAEITGYAGDYEGTSSTNRYYFAKRTGGSPTMFDQNETAEVVLVPREKLHEYLNQDRDKKIATEQLKAPTPWVKTNPAVDKPLEFTGMKKVGEKLGSNPGGRYVDADGNQYYIKQTKSNAHTQNEILAAALFAKTGMPTLKYHTINDGDRQYVGTDWQPLQKDNVSQLNTSERNAARRQFATQAWLANYDSAGTGGDNIGVVDGKVMPLDFGGSLLYRAQGLPKETGSYGKGWNSELNEWTSMRDPSVNPDAAALYKDMTPDELQASANMVLTAFPNKQSVTDIVNQFGPGNNTEKAQLADTLWARRQKLQQLAEAAKPKPKTPEVLKDEIAEWNPPGKPSSSITNYKGTDYNEVNAMMRFGMLEDKDLSNAANDIRAIEKWLDKSSSKEEVTLYRGVPADVVKQWKKFAKVGRVLLDDGFLSMTTSKHFADGWHGGSGMTIKIRVPKGAKMGTVYPKGQYDVEFEVLGQLGTALRITKMPGSSPYEGYEVTLEQAHMKHEGQ